MLAGSRRNEPGTAWLQLQVKVTADAVRMLAVRGL
eukprot:CAMPEP_0170610622 /NCGR_PEP_ID=MMETSP0224-20130122/22758_1 /TAXON_ID=285029 /ORGANISM="Togula jolla, Strain CCCM 725" /LENGTH=34 /DNA_ID= /DNA_START= /DNA_END= /DNA_ORIENTATION=